MRKRKKKKKRGYVLPGLGYSPAQKTSSGAGTHGGSRRQKSRRQRREGRQAIRREDWS